MAQKKKANFEEALLNLETIVKTLEKGDAPLDESLKLFQEGTDLIRQCNTMLDQAEQVVSRIDVQADGSVIETEFMLEEDSHAKS